MTRKWKQRFYKVKPKSPRARRHQAKVEKIQWAQWVQPMSQLEKRKTIPTYFSKEYRDFLRYLKSKHIGDTLGESLAFHIYDQASRPGFMRRMLDPVGCAKAEKNPIRAAYEAEYRSYKRKGRYPVTAEQWQVVNAKNKAAAERYHSPERRTELSKAFAAPYGNQNANAT